MRHFIVAAAIAAHPFGVRKAAVAGALVALTRHTHAGLMGEQRTAIDLAAVATAANDDLRPATGADKEAG